MAKKFEQFDELVMTADGPHWNRAQDIYFPSVSVASAIGDIGGYMNLQPPKFNIELTEEEQ